MMSLAGSEKLELDKVNPAASPVESDEKGGDMADPILGIDIGKSKHQASLLMGKKRNAPQHWQSCG